MLRINQHQQLHLSGMVDREDLTDHQLQRPRVLDSHPKLHLLETILLGDGAQAVFDDGSGGVAWVANFAAGFEGDGCDFCCRHGG